MPAFVPAFREKRRQGRRRGSLKGRSTDAPLRFLGRLAVLKILFTRL